MSVSKETKEKWAKIKSQTRDTKWDEWDKRIVSQPKFDKKGKLIVR